MAAVVPEPGAVGVLKCGSFVWMSSFGEDCADYYPCSSWRSEKYFRDCGRYGGVYGIKAELERLGSLEDVYEQRSAGSQQDFLLIGKIALGESLNNRRYSEIKQESVQDYLRRNNVLNRDPSA